MRRLIAAAAGVLVLAASASAQQPTQLPVIPVAPGGSIQPVGGSIHTPGQPGPVRTFVMASGGGYFGGNCPIAEPACNNGAGSLRSDANFVLGSTRSYFNPCAVGNYGSCGHGCGGKQRCPGATIYGRGGSGFNPCIYDSYLNH